MERSSWSGVTCFCPPAFSVAKPPIAPVNSSPAPCAKSRAERVGGKEACPRSEAAPSCLETPGVTSHRNPPRRRAGKPASPEPPVARNDHPERLEWSAQYESAKACRARILTRLQDEDQHELAASLAKCGEQLLLHCSHCGHQHVSERRCGQKWCPVCVRKIAALRSLKYERAAATCQWPLFLTLTRTNIGDLSPTNIRELRRAFGRFRRQLFWSKNVTGGVACIEITNIGRGWHPHLHCLLDCRWLSIDTPEPKACYSRAMKKNLCQRAAEELQQNWSKQIGQLMSNVHIKRTTGAEIVKEVCKYAVKGSDLVDSPDPIGPAIWAMKSTRLVTTFGSFYGKRLVTAEEKKRVIPCPSCQHKGTWVTDEQLQFLKRRRW